MLTKLINKFIFLDIDGVLNSEKYLTSVQYKTEESNTTFNYKIASNDKLGFEEQEVKFDDLFSESKIDSKAINLINTLVDITNAEVVVSSVWRLGYNLIQLRDIFKKRGATFDIWGFTPRIIAGKRHEEIEDFFLDFQNIEKCSYVIFDDIDEFKDSKCEKHFIHVDENIGLTQKDINRAIEILNG